jgi:hypothetical protein
VTGDDPIASPTLARLYLAQGHSDRARGVLAEVLRRDPYDGVALVLQRRVGKRDPAALACEMEGSRVRLRWTRVDADAAAHVVLVTFVRETDGARVRVTSVRCRGSNGSWDAPMAARAGAAAACIGALESGGSWRVLAVAPPIRW